MNSMKRRELLWLLCDRIAIGRIAWRIGRRPKAMPQACKGATWCVFYATVLQIGRIAWRIGRRPKAMPSSDTQNMQ